MRSRIVRLISILGWVGVALDVLLLIQIAWPGTSQHWALRPLSPLLPYRRAIDAAALALLLAAGLLDGAGRARADHSRLAAPPPGDEGLRWSQPHQGLHASDPLTRALVIHAGALPALFVAAAVLFFLFALARLPLFFVAILARFPARHLGRWAAMRRLMRESPDTVSLSARGVAAAGTLVPWEMLSCFEGDPAQRRFLVFARPFPRPPLIALAPPPEMAERVLASLRERLPQATATESQVWRRKEAVWVAQVSAPFLLACAAVAGAFLLQDRLLACAALALAFLLCHRWYWGLAGRILGLTPAPQPPKPAAGEGTASTEPTTAPSRALEAVSILSNVALALGLTGLLYAPREPAWSLGGYVAPASYALLAAGLVLTLVEYIWKRAHRPAPPAREE